jgi:transcription elongation factor Elf1
MNIYQQWLRERRWPIYSKAHRLVEKKLKEIWLKRERCPMCLQEWIVVCHHPDYNKPYEVVPCCNLCHSQIHRNIIECPKPIDLLKLW